MANYSQHKALSARRPTSGVIPRLMVAGIIPGVSLFLAGAGWSAGAGGGGGGSGGVADYQHAVESFNRQDYDAAAALLDKIPDDGNPKDRADVLNLRGAVYLHQKRYEKARALFSRAEILDPGLWAARFNEAEANFQQKNYGESRRQFSDLLTNTPRAGHPQEWELVQYKSLLSSLLGGDEKPVRTFVAAHAKDSPAPSVAYYFLNAALEYRQSHQREAGQWLSRVSASYPMAAEQVYAETFAQLGWPAPHGEHSAALVESNGSGAPLQGGPQKPSAAFSAMDAQAGSAQKISPATLAVVQLMPGHQSAVKPLPRQPVVPPVEMPAFRYGGPIAIPLPAEPAAVQNAPPAPGDDLKSAPGVEGGMMTGAGEANVLARHRSNPTPSPATPSPATPASTPDASPADSSASSSSAGSPAATGSPGPSASPDASASPAAAAAAAPKPAFVQKYEAAYVKFIQKDYEGAKVLLDEADTIQAGQPSSISLRGQIFKHYYEGAYVDYLKADYAGAMSQLDAADGVQANQPDASNLRGLVYSRQHNYEQAESMFKKAIQTDPTFWAAKFNLAELPFNYRNYTAARSRFEDLFSQTDPVKQPREAELTQFKVFLTLLLEGKEAGARSFMEHFTFSGTTPARYFCQSALDFYHGDVDKALGWLDSAKKEYPAQLVSIFIESFYRVGWMTDPSAHPELASGSSAGGGATPGASPAASPAAPSASPAVAAASPSVAPGATPTVAVAKPTPAPSAAPSATPVIALAKLTPAPSAAPSATPVIALAKLTPAPSAVPIATPVVAVVKPTPAPSAAPSATPIVAAIKPAPVPSATPVIALAKPVPSPTATVPVVAVAPKVPSATPAASVASAEVASNDSGSPAPEEEEAANGGESTASQVVRYLVLILVVTQTIFVWTKVALAFKRRNARLLARTAGSTRTKTVPADKVESPR